MYCSIQCHQFALRVSINDATVIWSHKYPVLRSDSTDHPTHRYRLPGMPNALQHDYHHQVFNANYGVLGILDELHGTRGGFASWQECWFEDRKSSKANYTDEQNKRE
jgi:sterol desaturase/sphingolipid hydroxylase (fatty acid hydroxylase superfamily)